MLHRLSYATRATLSHFLRAWETQARFSEPPPKTWAEAKADYERACERKDTRGKHEAIEAMKSATTFAFFRQRQNGGFTKEAGR